MACGFNATIHILTSIIPGIISSGVLNIYLIDDR